MQLVSSAGGVLRTQKMIPPHPTRPRVWSGALSALADLFPCDGLRAGAVHEILGASAALPWSFALLLAHAAANVSPQRSAIVWSDPRGELYPPALAAALTMRNLFLLRAGDPAEELWAVAQCLRCPAVGATVASPAHLEDIEARRLQLAAEHGGGVGLLIRRQEDLSRAHYAAATRWLVRPAPGNSLVQRWSVQLVHGHGGKIGENIFLEICRDAFHPDHVCAVDALADRSDSAPAAKASA